jgi:SUMO ligase MMS21 Smc5/6 complex component
MQEHGSYSSEADITRTGSTTCSICFDPYLHPVTLSCNHVFCEHCIYEWLENEDTCPVCRARVKEERGEGQLIKESAVSALPVVI